MTLVVILLSQLGLLVANDRNQLKLAEGDTGGFHLTCLGSPGVQLVSVTTRFQRL